jgi:hypothetical protein
VLTSPTIAPAPTGSPQNVIGASPTVTTHHTMENTWPCTAPSRP